MKRGVVLSRTFSNPFGNTYLLYPPMARRRRDEPLVLVHGTARKAERVVEIFRPFAERYGVTLVAPVFDKENFAGYQQLGLNSSRYARVEPRVGVRRILDDVNGLTGISTERFHLFGHSGGAQFAHRYAMVYPESVLRYVVSASGWYSFPDSEKPFPYGMNANRRFPGIVPRPEDFLLIPACVMVGEKDTLRDASLRKSEEIDRRQGRTRLERAERWAAAMNAASRRRGFAPSVRLHVLPGAGHDFDDMATHGAADFAARFLFEEGA